MLAKFAKRATIVFAAMAALIIAASGQAQAADAYLYYYDLDHTRLGYMVHLDAEPDKIKVCDTYADGYTVSGSIWEGRTQIGSTVRDGSDAGCNYGTVPLESGHTYEMVLCWEAPRAECRSRTITE
ncbi:hypothetical protein [Glycomyces salinus]|uniref:hypothetical protein n=1 Tax=Glycomyces salinus TaxID=980294 RepID=UPI0018ECBD2E|nr:hypothetical protein [Glycomyces salinus]